MHSKFKFAKVSLWEAGLMTYTAANQQGVIEVFQPHFWRALRLSIFIYSSRSDQLMPLEQDVKLCISNYILLHLTQYIM